MGHDKYYQQKIDCSSGVLRQGHKSTLCVCICNQLFKFETTLLSVEWIKFVCNGKLAVPHTPDFLVMHALLVVQLIA